MEKRLEISVLIYPKKEIVVSCADCKEELLRVEYEGYADYSRKRRLAERQARVCTKCGAMFAPLADNVPVISWGRTIAGDWIARAKDGDFLVWREGQRYKWRYRRYGAETVEVHCALSKAAAMIACTKHEGWK
jgi:hypothetical protein